jgi:hypothetical protein
MAGTVAVSRPTSHEIFSIFKERDDRTGTMATGDHQIFYKVPTVVPDHKNKAGE